MINSDDYTNENQTDHNSKWPYIPDHSYIILIIGGSGSNKQPARYWYLYAKGPYEAKYQFLINKRKSIGLKHYDDPKAVIE